MLIDDQKQIVDDRTQTKNFIMRSQLDCHDARLPGTGVFDIKTRACMPIRLDIFNFEENSGYLIRKQYGQYESFEREYYDLIRSAFLKYQLSGRVIADGAVISDFDVQVPSTHWKHGRGDCGVS